MAGSQSVHVELLRRHLPVLSCDSGEWWFPIGVNGEAEVIYGHAAEGSDGRLWLQYWFHYAWNDPRLLGRWLRVGVHEGDWEMIQLRLDSSGQAPDLAVYAQHSRVAARTWSSLERVSQRPVVFVGRGSHASYFRPGWHWTGVWLERANGRGRVVEPTLEVIDEADPASAWALAPQRWGATQPRGGLMGRLGLAAASPHGPGHQRQWRDPAVLLGEVSR